MHFLLCLSKFFDHLQDHYPELFFWYIACLHFTLLFFWGVILFFHLEHVPLSSHVA